MEFNVLILQAAEAERCVWSPEFVSEWDMLLAETPSSTVFQSAKYAQIWWSVYGPACRLAVAVCRSSAGLLVGYYALAKLGDGDWGSIGLHQCDYPAVLARGDDPVIVTAILRSLQQALSLRRLSFVFLPPASPVEGYVDAALAAEVRDCPLPYRTFGDVMPPSKRTKQKLGKLRQLGARAEIVDISSAHAEFLPKFIRLHEARQKAMARTASFESDPLKARYLVALARDAGLLHVAALWIEARLVAAAISIKDRSRIILGMLAHDEDLEALSPAAMLIHELGLLCRGSEIRTIDLTPGGTYKQRFATGTETAFTAELTWSIGGACRIWVRCVARHALNEYRKLFARSKSTVE